VLASASSNIQKLINDKNNVAILSDEKMEKAIFFSLNE
jgi:hypothetical protein